ncbi:hypothetical protein HanLR1_Chr12g0438971 [Helianthus annuus]|nr:hypothetical protein HanHA89_Chr12g0461331 [Helianthus annuus]KAJ0674349.1 hypothetical protein HanLR1_Chr12g0438971 [Helianthus annuus]
MMRAISIRKISDAAKINPSSIEPSPFFFPWLAAGPPSNRRWCGGDSTWPETEEKNKYT